MFFFSNESEEQPENKKGFFSALLSKFIFIIFIMFFSRLIGWT